MNRILAIARKELLHVLRDPRSLMVALVMPLAMILLYGRAIDMELRELPIAVLDLDCSAEARRLVEGISAGGFIVVAERLADRSRVEPGFRSGRFRAALVIPAGFGADLAGGSSPVQLLVDGADAATAATVAAYMERAVSQANRRMVPAGGRRTAALLDAELRVWFNPQLESAHFIVPGLVAIVLVMICALLTSIAVVREKETGTLEQILTAPVNSWQLILGKIQPYLLIGAVDTALILAAGVLFFDVPMRGSWLALTGYTFIYLLIALGLGLLISAVTRTQQVAMFIALTVTLLPTLLLSGFIFAHAGMPWPLRALAQAIPATWYLRTIRGVMLVGENWHPLEGAVLLAMALGTIALAAALFKERLE